MTEATKEGQGGCQLWISTEHHILHKEGKRIPMSPRDFTVFHSDPHLMIVFFHGLGCRLIFVVGHAPHSLSDSQTAWWQNFDRLLRSLPANTPKILLMDANCRMNGFDDLFCGTYGPPVPQGHSDSSECLHQLLVDLDLFLPQTFPDQHRGCHFTWTLGAAKARLDYVALPRSWKDSSLATWVEKDIRSGASEQDHSMVICQIRTPLKADQFYLPHVAKFDREAMKTTEGRKKCQLIFDNAPVLAHTLDPTLHCHLLEEHLRSAMKTYFPFNRRCKKKSYISDETYQHVLKLRCHRRELRHLNLQFSRQLLFGIFHLWRHGVQDYDRLRTFDSTLKTFDLSTAHALRQLQRTDQKMKYFLKNDLKTFSTRLVEDIASSPPQDVLQALKPLLPKHRRGIFSGEHLPVSWIHMDDQLQPHRPLLECFRNTTDKLKGAQC